MAIKTLFTMLDPATWFFLVLIFLYFLKSFKELLKVRNIGVELERYVKILDKVKGKILDESEKIETLEDRYKTYIETLENEKKFEQLDIKLKEYNAVLKYRNYSRVKAEEYFNENTILENKINIHSLGNKTSILTGLGILGTFVGLTWGLFSINGGDLARSLTVIDTLLPKMSLAFITSVFGMGSSIVYSSFQKRILGDVYKNINEIETILEFLFPSQLDIETTLARIEVNLEKFTKEASKSIEKATFDVAEGMFKKFGNTFSKSAQSAGANLLSGVNNALGEIFNQKFMNDFKTIHKSFEKIAITLEKNKAILENIDRASENSKDIYENAQKTANAYDHFVKRMDDFMQTILSFERVQTEFGNEVKNMVENSNRIQEDMENLFVKNQVEMKKIIDYMVNGYDLTNKEIKELIIQVLNVNREVLSVGNQISTNNRDRIVEIGNSIDGSLEKIQNKIETFDSTIKTNTESTNQILRSNIENINNSIIYNNDKLNQYSERVERSIEEQNRNLNEQNRNIMNVQDQIARTTAAALKEYDRVFSDVNKELLKTVSIVKEVSKDEE
ncbi:MotA/TolQ/ExbB proton channel family protein [uncultured Fusobacterium sp.]|uniref:MotA/TolQ/ExbB proton channel family protein n=3 Tax=uncultured Fusobacterium sp. TaxID=159267 RepID=UPI0025EAB87B|nr:MotA/TolQ/ExbB proton channel family protein [uncultured Fusobacterium sp.]